MWRTFRRFAGRREYGRLVDAGGGEGYFAASFAPARFKVVVDAVAPALAVAARRGIAAVRGDVRRLPLRARSCDLVLSSDVLEHLTPGDVTVALAEVERVLKKGGTALVHTSCYGLYLRRWLRRAPGGGRLDADDLKDGHLNRLTARELERAIDAAGLKIRKRMYFKHVFQPAAALAVKLVRGDGGEGNSKEEVLAGRFARALNAVRIFVAGLDAFLFGWLPGGAVIYKLEK